MFDCVTGNIPGLDKDDDGLTGVRFIQKSNGNTLNSFRVEVWTKHPNEESEANREIKDYLEESILQDIMQVNPAKFGVQFKIH